MTGIEASQILSPLGVVAGNGILPLQVMENAVKQGIKVVAIGHHGETDASIANFAESVHWVRVGQLGKIIKILKKSGVKQVVFAGGIRRANLFGVLRLDLRALKLVAQLVSVRDDSLLRGIAREMEKDGIQIISASELLESSAPGVGVLTNRTFNEQEQRDAVIAWTAAKGAGALDIGQGAVAFDGLIVAVEAVEGTDAMIERSGLLARSAGGKTGCIGPVLVKVSKPQQDLRLDLPTVGLQTLEKLRQAGFSGLVLEAGHCIILEPEKFVTKANSLKLVVEIHSEESISRYSSKYTTR